MNNIVNFSQSFKYGYRIDKIIPQDIDKEVVNEWVDNMKIISFKQNEGNFLVTCYDDSNGQDEIMYYFYRFFNIGNTTHCSVDFSADNQMQLIEKLTDMLEQKHTF